ncbi:hypothetical protein ACFLR4_02600 [Bacteroidota bacterium]
MYEKIFSSLNAKNIDRILKSVLIILVIIFFISLFFSFKDLANYSYYPKNEGWKTLFDIFSLAIKVLGGIAFILTLLIAIWRLQKTDEQNTYLQMESRFNNFESHKRQFLEFFKQEGYYFDIPKIDPLRSIYIKLYRELYGATFKSFSFEINENSMKKIRGFKKAINDSPLSKKSISIFDANDFGLSQFSDYCFKSIIKRDSYDSLVYYEKYKEFTKKDDGKIKFSGIFYKEILDVVYMLEFMRTLSEFENEKEFFPEQNWKTFIDNFISMCDYFYKEEYGVNL